MEEKELRLDSDNVVFSALTHNRFFSGTQQNYTIPALPTLDAMVEAFLSIKNHLHIADLSNIAVVGMQHILETTVTLVDALIQLGISPQHIYIAGKVYSTSSTVEIQLRKRNVNVITMEQPQEPGQYLECCRLAIKKLWRKCAKNSYETYLILDDGGRTSEYMPEFIRFEKRVAIIEQTQGGLYSPILGKFPCPLIEVASSAVKKQLEPLLIAEAVLVNVKDTLARLKLDSLDKKTIYGVVGNGAIGHAVVNYLLNAGYKVAVYDENSNAFQGLGKRNFFRVESLEALIINAQCIFGCTGKDITQNINILEIAKNDKIFISCTSEDKEFLSLLKTIAKQSIIAVDTLADISCLTPAKSKITVASGGFPINFDRKPWNVPANDIEVTQGLLLGGCIQAILAASKPVEDGMTINHSSRQSLDPFIQRFVVNKWISRQPKNRYADKLIACFQDTE